MDEFVYLNGEIIPAEQAVIRADDQGFLYGAGIFETMRAYGGSIFLLERHVQRLLASAPLLGISGFDAATLQQACRDTVAANRLESARVRLTVSQGTLKRPTILVQAQPYKPPVPEKYRDGYRAVVSSQPRYSRSLVISHKTTNYLECLLAREQARESGFDEALFLNEAEYLTEGAASNIFVVLKDGRLVTPPVEAGLLTGITRGFVLELAAQNGIRCVQENIRPADLAGCSEAFITNSMVELMPLCSITPLDGSKYIFEERRVAQRLRSLYTTVVRTG